MKRTRLDLLFTALFGIGAMLVILLAIVATVCELARWGERKLHEQPATVAQVEQASEPARVQSPDTETIYEIEDPFEAQHSLEAILAKCQCVPDCYIVAYAPELVEGWRPEYKSDTGLYLTSSGMWAGLYHTVATDPAVIPTGSTVVIDGDIYIAADTGVKGKVIDVMVDVETALTYGCHRADVWWCLEGEP